MAISRNRPRRHEFVDGMNSSSKISIAQAPIGTEFMASCFLLRFAISGPDHVTRGSYYS